MLGDATLVSLRIGEALVSAKAPRTFRARIGDPIALRVRPETCHLFDARSGRRVAA
jgi:multiple sugar transport system ATP-binding protein